jgi:hypothetical protein
MTSAAGGGEPGDRGRACRGLPTHRVLLQRQRDSELGLASIVEHMILALVEVRSPGKL